jgi:hypothetical protein
MTRLEATGAWIGQIEECRAFNVLGSPLCVMPWDDGMQLFAGFHTRQAQKDIARALEVDWGDL